MLIVIALCSPPYSVSASASAVSVLPTPDGPQQEHAMRLLRIVELGARGLDALGDQLDRVLLADDALAERIGELQRPAFRRGPCGRAECRSSRHDRGHRVWVDGGQHERRIALQVGQRLLGNRETRLRRSPCIRIECVGRIVVEQQRTGIDDRGQRVAFGLPARVEAIEFGSGGSNVVLDRVAPRRITGTERAFAPDPLLFDAQAVDAAAHLRSARVPRAD